MGDPFKLLKKYVSPGVLPLEFDVDFYRFMEDDLVGFSDQQLFEHFEAAGRQEGRSGSPGAHRYGLVGTILSDSRILEIGPFFRPACIGQNVKYFDVLSQEGLWERAIKNGIPAFGCPHIHYVSPTGDLSIVTENFDIVFSAHCIEHQPDLIRHLHEVARILGGSGMYYLVIPDKRYCIDHFIAESTAGEIEQAHKERRTVHAFKSVYEHCAMTTHNDQAAHWRGEHDDPRAAEREARGEYAEKLYREAGGGYIDVHAWQFTPMSFRKTMTDLAEMGLSPFSVERVYNTLYGQNEFTAVLKAT